MIAVQAAVGLAMVPFLLGRLGKEGYGVVGIIGAIIGFAGIADLGLRSALNRELSEKVALQDADGFRRLSSSALLLYVGIALLIGAIGAVLAPWFSSVFNVGNQYRDLVILLLRTYAPFAVLLSFVTPVFTAGICSFMRYDVQNHVTMGSHLFSSLLMFVCLSVFEANPLIIWCLLGVLGGLIRIGFMWFFYRSICFGGRLSPKFVDFEILRPLFRLGGSMYVLQLIQMLAVQMDPLIISRFLGMGDVALYQVGSRLPQMFKPIAGGVMDQVVPLTTRYHVASNWNREQQVLILGTKYILYLGAFFSVGMILFGDPFCRLWLYDRLGDDVQPVAFVLKMWAVAHLFEYAGGSQWPILLAKKKMRFVLWLLTPAALLNFVLSVLLVGYTSLGIIGVLVGTVITHVIVRPIVIFYVSRLVKVSVAKYLREAYCFPFVFLISLIFLYTLSLHFVPINNWMSLIFYVAVFCVVAGGLFLGLEWKSMKLFISNLPV